MNEHPPQADFDLFVIDALDAERRAALVAHLRECPACSSTLSASARLEVLAWQVAKQSQAVPVARRWVVAAVALGALAAMGLLAVRGRAPDPEAQPIAADPQPDLVVCIDAACIDDAFQSGLAPQAPTLIVPRYETMFRSTP